MHPAVMGTTTSSGRPTFPRCGRVRVDAAAG